MYVVVWPVRQFHWEADPSGRWRWHCPQSSPDKEQVYQQISRVMGNTDSNSRWAWSHCVPSHCGWHADRYGKLLYGICDMPLWEYSTTSLHVNTRHMVEWWQITQFQSLIFKLKFHVSADCAWSYNASAIPSALTGCWGWEGRPAPSAHCPSDGCRTAVCTKQVRIQTIEINAVEKGLNRGWQRGRIHGYDKTSHRAALSCTSPTCTLRWFHKSPTDQILPLSRHELARDNVLIWPQGNSIWIRSCPFMCQCKSTSVIMDSHEQDEYSCSLY